MKTNKQVLKGTDTSEIIKVCEKISQKTKLTQTGGYGSVRIGTVYVKMSEDEHRNVVDEVQHGYLFLHIGADEKGFLYVTEISFFDDYAHMGMKSGKYITEDDIISIKLFEDAYESIVNKIISINKYCNNVENNNKKQIALMKTI